MFIENACKLPQKPSGAKAFYLINFMFSEKFGLLVKLFSSVSSVFFIAVKLKNVSFMYSPRPYDKKIDSGISVRLSTKKVEQEKETLFIK